MRRIASYLELIRKSGRPLTEINPGSKEYALKIDDAISAIQLLKNGEFPILGGEILSERSGKLAYAYQIWGQQYHSLNWFCDKYEKESHLEYCVRSYEEARIAIKSAQSTANALGEKCYINFIV